jgi:hypothetical protein
LSAVPQKKVTELRAAIRHEGFAAMRAHAQGDARAVDLHLKRERELVAELRRLAPEMDLNKVAG